MKKDFLKTEKDIKNLLKWDGADGCLASNKITVEGYKVGYMYRENPENDYDSGWRFLAGMEDDEYINYYKKKYSRRSAFRYELDELI